MAMKRMGGSPVSDPSNPYRDGAGLEPEDILSMSDPDALFDEVKDELDAYGSNPVVNDSAAERPLNPPQTQP